MILFRSAEDSDLEAIYQLAIRSGIGMTSLPKNKEKLKARLDWSSESYNKKLTSPGHEYYFFVLEDKKQDKLIGISAIEARTGHSIPFYSYRLSKQTQVCKELNVRNDYEVLSLVNDNQGKSEICTLFLDPEFRKNNNGLLLSKARFLFMADHEERFCSSVIAELRGVSDEQGIAPFWEHVGQHFFHITFSEADRLTLATDKQFIADLMPSNPIYVKLLPDEAQAVIGKAHPSSMPALNILFHEGFRYNGYVDIFDAGPTIEAPLKSIKTLANSQSRIITKLSDDLTGANYLIANSRMNFRATINHALLNPEDDSCSITKAAADLLEVAPGDRIRIAPLLIHTKE